jgi:hypothetical protein
VWLDHQTGFGSVDCSGRRAQPLVSALCGINDADIMKSFITLAEKRSDREINKFIFLVTKKA